MSAALPTLRLLGGEPDDDGAPRYEPGGTIPAVVRLEADRAQAFRAVYARARWRASGGGAVDGGTTGEIRVSQGPIEPGASVELPFDYPLPWVPWSYTGELVEISWELEVRLDAPMAADQRASAPFVLAPATPGERRRVGPASRKRGAA